MGDFTTQDIYIKFGELLDRKKVERLAETKFFKYVELPVEQIRLNNGDRETLHKKLKLLYWAVQGVQIELGYMLFHQESYNNFKRNKNPEGLELSYMTFMHHHFLAIECIYRCWERVTHILNYINTGLDKKNGYYTQIVCDIEKSENVDEALIVELKKHQRHWNRIAELRNNYSHEYSSLIDGISFQVQFSKILDSSGAPMIKIKEKRKHLNSVFTDVRKKYDYLSYFDELLKIILNLSA